MAALSPQGPYTAAAAAESPHSAKRRLEERLREVEEIISREPGDRDSSTAVGYKETTKTPPLEEESGQPSFMQEVYEHLERNSAAVGLLADEIHRLRAIIATERNDRRQEQERVLKILGSIIEHAGSPFPQRNPTNVPPRW